MGERKIMNLFVVKSLLPLGCSFAALGLNVVFVEARHTGMEWRAAAKGQKWKQRRISVGKAIR